MRLLISGLCGRMGAEVARLVRAGVRGAEADGSAGVDPRASGTEDLPCARSFDEAAARPEVFAAAECLIDFSHPSAVPTLLDYAEARRLPAVIATTGHDGEGRARIARAAERIPVFLAANLSLGAALLTAAACRVAAALPEAEIEIIETHHDRKADAPSGTALTMAEALRAVRPGAFPVAGRSGLGRRSREEIGIHSVRIGNIAGRHEILLATPSETISLTHEVHDRALFAEGALAAAAFLTRVGAPGLYGMADLIADG